MQRHKFLSDYSAVDDSAFQRSTSSITCQHSTWHWLVVGDSARGQLDTNRSTPGYDPTPVSTVLRKLVWFFIINIFLIKRKLSKLKSAWKMLDSRCLISTTIWKLSLITLRSKRFQSRYRAKVRAPPPPSRWIRAETLATQTRPWWNNPPIIRLRLRRMEVTNIQKSRKGDFRDGRSYNPWKFRGNKSFCNIIFPDNFRWILQL